VEILLLGKAFVEFGDRDDLALREVSCVPRAQDNLEHRQKRKFQRRRFADTLAAHWIELSTVNSRKACCSCTQWMVAPVDLGAEMPKMLLPSNTSNRAQQSPWSAIVAG
jgi:hypothetical protein